MIASVYIVDGAYARDEILDSEEDMLATLKFSVSFISPLHFLRYVISVAFLFSLLTFFRRFSKAAQSDYHIHTLCKYIIELSMVDIRLLKYKL